jgi:hypothetical protein
MATKKKKTSSRNDPLTVDFSGTESRGGAKGGPGRPHYKEGDYRVKVIKTETGKSSQKKTPYARVVFKFTEGKYKGKDIYDDFYLTEKALWRFRNLLEACGLKVPSKRTKIDLTKLKGRTLGITLEDDVYEKDDGTERVSSRVSDTFLESELDDVEEDLDADLDDDDEEDEDEEDEDEDDDDEDDDEDDDDEDLEELDVDDL